MRTARSKIELLRSVPGLTTLGERDLARLAPLFDDIRIDVGKVLVREGQSSHELVLIVEGSAELTRGGNTVGAVGPGDFLGETAVLDRAAHTATATAATPMRILLAGRESFGKLRSEPDVLRQIALHLAGRLRVYEDARTPAGTAA
ncbi:MAG TPA: cyclic nucleotide-binding domain-containing protein [Acidimicrobiia bacterium]|nr:cyclic nucleotide-binding domain-containing protein [Acidimicrobiia bacterium]